MSIKRDRSFSIALSRFLSRMPSTSIRQTCCLCGIGLGRQKRRFQCTEEIRSFVRKHCKISPFLYSRLVVVSHSPSARVGVCIPCVNWKRRVETNGLKRTKQPLLQLDQLILFLMQPGVFPEPDHRCMRRLVEGVRQADNPYKHLFPVPVQSILDMTKDNTYRACVAAWWEYNGRTEFFSSGQEARRVRSVVKALGVLSSSV